MTRYATILNPSLTDAEGHSKFLNRLFSSGVALASNANGWKVTQRGAGANMSVDVAAGDGLLNLPSTAYCYWGWTDATENVAVTTANPTNPRIDTVVAWIDTSVTTTVSANSPGALKFQIMAGTPAGSPVAMSDVAIQSALGAGVAWIKLAPFLVPAGSTSVVNANISDARTAISSLVYAAIMDGSITTAKIADGSVTNAKLNTASGEVGGAWTTFSGVSVSATAGTLTNGSASGEYKKIGKRIDINLAISIVSNGTGSGAIKITLSGVYAPISSKTFVISGRADGVSGKSIHGKINGTTGELFVTNYDNTYPAANGEVLRLTGVYEAA